MGANTKPNSLHSIVIAHANSTRGFVTLLETLADGVQVHWESSDPNIVSVTHRGKVAPGQVNRPRPGGKVADVTLEACVSVPQETCRSFQLCLQPAIDFTWLRPILMSTGRIMDG